MSKQDDFEIQEDLYDWCVRSFQSIERHIGLNVKVCSGIEHTHTGQIFLFNHFARLETVIPHYIIHKETGHYCRSIADKGLFRGSERFANFLRKNGTMPNNHPGLLPFLAAEILRGRKVIVFPEGGMVKDRRVVGDDGEFEIFSGKDGLYRKHHRGAAVLALTLEMFKQRIKSLFENGDEERIERWRKSLGLISRESLLEEVNKPTLIVPSTITFYPIRVQDNFLNHMADLFMKKTPVQMMEELAIEGNILFKDTDMDIRFGEPIPAAYKLSWMEKLILQRYFMSVESLDDLFSLRQDETSLAKRMLGRFMLRESRQVRDAYMEGIYQGVTINLNHVASTLIIHMLEQGINRMPRKEFLDILYAALKKVQTSEGVHLHRSLQRPGFYKGLHIQKSKGFERFLEMCDQAGLVKQKDADFVFMDKLRNEYGFNEVRMENPLLVYANEAGPIKAVIQAVEESFAKSQTKQGITEEETAVHMFDDELRDYAWLRKHFSKPRYTKVNAQENLTKDGRPYLHVSTKKKKIGVLLIHGFTASPAELREFGEHLYEEKGYPVLGMRLPGHGTSPWDLHVRTWDEWMDAVRRNYQILSAYVDHIVIVGFSTGGTLATILAAEKPDKLLGIIPVAAPLAIQNKGMLFVPLVERLNKVASWVPAVEGIVQFYDNNPTTPDINYRSVSIHALNELRSTMITANKALPSVSIPTCIIQGTGDETVKPESAQKIFDGIQTPENHKQLHWIETDQHGIIADNVGATQKIIEDFIKKLEDTLS